MGAKKRDELLAQIDQFEKGEIAVADSKGVETPETEVTTETPEAEIETPEPEVASGEETPEATPESSVETIETTPQSGKKRSKEADIFAAIKASEDRAKKQTDELLSVISSLKTELAELKPKPVDSVQQPTEETDPDIQAWNTAFKDSADQFVMPEVQRIRQELAAERLNTNMHLASLKPGRDDYWDLVNLQDQESPLFKHLQAHPEVQKRIRESKNPGDALYEEATYLRNSTPDARKSWQDELRAQIRAEEEAKAQKQLQAALKKAQANGGGVKSDSIMTGGTMASSEEPLTAEALKTMPAAKKREILAKIDSGKLRVEDGVLVEV